ncbi:PQQ-dependent dehydrogenase, methanol/ethanol family [Tsuneonella sp. CC-YZS046]|uniref:PQQ-dependent dehydrogenase, methanol/ethanol family n=1 Tax=Tsuneonella sp. CC-YZS046 TaxID=3042152 RepID=UPI002D77525B|nr:PQQ-dependent dehydrogenase, methanol/ethanol family [Tsuneonella sp. CC-YZS046]WRO65331.1 PQQ-dependent dehydrogenase, methanol/ethanol family [Tsuneonella sp. CC-YZS046]
MNGRPEVSPIDLQTQQSCQSMNETERGGMLGIRRSIVGSRWLICLIVICALAAAGIWFLGRNSATRAAWVVPMDGALFAQNAKDWRVHGGNDAEQRYSPLKAIHTGNVGELGLAWSVELDTARGQEATPLVIDGTIYVSTAWSKVMAIDGMNGKVLWEYDPQVPGGKARDACCDVVNRGVAYRDGKLFVGTLDGRLIALDAKTGKPVWEVQTTDTAKPYTITGAPRIAGNLVIIGNGGAEFGVRGYVGAYDAETGKQAWRFYTVPRPDGKADGAVSDATLAEKASSTWFDGAWHQTGGGGTVWDSIIYDPELDQIIIGTGNGTPWNHRIRSGGKGDNLFLSSILALDAKSGQYKWHYQVNPGESWDFTATQPIVLANLIINGASRKVLMQAPKNGFFYVIDRTNGKLLSARNFVPVNWARGIDLASGRPLETGLARYDRQESLINPSAFGAHNWYPMAFSPSTGLVYLPVQEVSMVYAQDQNFRYRPGTFNTGVYSEKNRLPDDPAAVARIRASLKGALIAWDPVRQREVWRASQPGPGSGGALATAGNLVFEGNMQGAFKAFDASNGKELWRFQAQTAVQGSPVTYEANGQQYVVVMSGYGGGFGISTPLGDGTRNRPNGRVLAFRLGAEGRLPAFDEGALPPFVRVREVFPRSQIAIGQRVYETTCSWCHGSGGQSSGVAPDLRRSVALDDAKLWDEIVMGGMLSERGMGSFKGILSNGEVEAVRAYVANHAQ